MDGGKINFCHSWALSYSTAWENVLRSCALGGQPGLCVHASHSLPKSMWPRCRWLCAFCAKLAHGVMHGVRAQPLQMCHNLPFDVLALPRALQGAGYTHRLQSFIHLALEDISFASSSDSSCFLNSQTHISPSLCSNPEESPCFTDWILSPPHSYVEALIPQGDCIWK